MNQIKLILDNSVIDAYAEHYFLMHPKAKKKPIEYPYHPSINTWMIMQRPQMNGLKQKWKDFIVWWIDSLGYSNMGLDNFEIEYKVYMPTKRRIDPDNITPKFIHDGFVESGFFIDDDGTHMKSLTLKTGYDKNNPRTEITITY